MTIALRVALALLLQVQIPAPTGYVNDFAGVINSDAAARMTALITELHQKTGADVAVVTLPDLGGRSAADIAVQIGREWKLGGAGEAGDSAKNLGVVILLVPRKDHRPGTGDVFIATGRGAEGFLPDVRVGRIRDAMLPALAAEDYGPALALGVDLIAQALAAEFGVTLTGPAADPVGRALRERPGVNIPIGWILVLIIFLLVVTRGRILWWVLWGLSQSRGGGGWRGGAGGGGGGFGGFGGGGGFSGGGAGGRF